MSSKVKLKSDLVFHRYLSILKRARFDRNLQTGIEIEREMNENGFKIDLKEQIHLKTVLINLYGECRDMNRFMGLWNDLKSDPNELNVHSIGAAMHACIQCGHFEMALSIFDETEISLKNHIIFLNAIKCAGKLMDHEKGLSIHLEINSFTQKSMPLYPF